MYTTACAISGQLERCAWLDLLGVVCRKVGMYDPRRHEGHLRVLLLVWDMQ